MAEPDKNVDILKQAIKVFDDLLDKGEWQGSLLLENTGKKIQGYRDDAQDILDDITGVKQKKIAEADAEAADELLTVYVSIFQMDPNDMLAWQATLNSIGEYSASRPIYLSEDHVQELIRSRPDPSREAYVEVTIKKSDILELQSGSKPVFDKFEHEQVSVRQGTIVPDNVKRFVHRNKVYHFQEGALKRVDENG